MPTLPPLNFLNWIVPTLFGLMCAGIIAIVKMWSEQSNHAIRIGELEKDNAANSQRLDDHQERIGKQDTTLARIEAGIEYLKRAFDSALGKAP